MSQPNNKINGRLKAPINFLALSLLGIFILFIGVVAYYFTLLIVKGEMVPAFARIGLSTKFAAATPKKSALSDPTLPQNIATIRQFERGGATEIGSFPLNRLRVGILVPEDKFHLSPSLKKKGDGIAPLPTSDMINDNLSAWINFCTKENIQFQTTHTQELVPGKSNYDVLILPANPLLSDFTITRITNFLDQGGGLIAVGDCGAMDELGRVREIPFLNRVIGIAKAENDSKPRKSYIPLTIKANSPLSINIPLGARIGITPDHNYVPAQVIEERTIQDGYWYNPNLDLGIPLFEIRNSTGLCHGSYNNGRFVWFGFGINSITGDNTSQKIKPNLIRNALLWVAQKPLARIRPWPADFQCAAVINGDIEHNFTNVLNVIKILQEKKIKGSFFLLSDLASSNQSLVKAMARVGEIGLHGYSHIEFKGLSYEVQLKEIQKSKAILERISRKKITGFRPPYGSFDETTIRALDKNGLNYLVSTIIDGNSLAPEFIPYLDDFIIIPKPNKDDYDIFYRDSITTPEAVLSELKDEFDRIYDLGGYYVLTYHTQILAAPPNYPVIAKMVDYMKNRKVWLTTWQEITEWWRKIKNIRLYIEEKDESNFDLVLNNFGSATVENVQIQVFPGNPFTDPSKIQIQFSNQEPVIWNFGERTKSYNILIKKLKPKALHRINFKLGS